MNEMGREHQLWEYTILLLHSLQNTRMAETAVTLLAIARPYHNFEIFRD